MGQKAPKKRSVVAVKQVDCVVIHASVKNNVVTRFELH